MADDRRLTASTLSPVPIHRHMIAAVLLALTLVTSDHIAIANRLQHFLGFLLRHLAVLRRIERGNGLLLLTFLRFFFGRGGQFTLRRLLALLFLSFFRRRGVMLRPLRTLLRPILLLLLLLRLGVLRLVLRRRLLFILLSRVLLLASVVLL